MFTPQKAFFIFTGGVNLKSSSGYAVEGVAKTRVFPESFLPCNSVLYWYMTESLICQNSFITLSNVFLGSGCYTFTPKYGLNLFNALVPVKRQMNESHNNIDKRLKSEVFCKSLKSCN